MEALVFWILAMGVAGAGLAVVCNRNPVASALSLVLTFLFLAGIFVSLEAFFLAMVQIIVYAGAVMVLFLFIIMLLDIKVEEKRPIPWVKVSIVGLVSLLFGGVYFSILACASRENPVLVWGENTVALTAGRLGKDLFGRFVLPFEVTALLLLVATIGVILLSRRESSQLKRGDTHE